MHELKKIPTSTAHQSRLQLFQPTRRPKVLARTIETSWGTATVNGKIGQVHADILEAFCRQAKAFRVSATGQIQILVDPYKIRTSVGGGKEYSGDTLWKMIEEIKSVTIELRAPAQKIRVMGGILDLIEESPATVISHNGKPRQLWRVTFNAAFSMLLAEDLALTYDPAPLAKLKAGISQAIARHILTHKDQPNGGWVLDDLIKTVGAGETPTAMKDRRKEIRADSESLANVGVILDGKRLFKKKEG
jgi:hypothetical protein